MAQPGFFTVFYSVKVIVANVFAIPNRFVIVFSDGMKTRYLR